MDIEVLVAVDDVIADTILIVKTGNIGIDPIGSFDEGVDTTTIVEIHKWFKTGDQTAAGDNQHVHILDAVMGQGRIVLQQSDVIHHALQLVPG